MVQTGSLSIHFQRWFESRLKWTGCAVTWLQAILFVVMRTLWAHYTCVLYVDMAASWTAKETRALVGVWGQANVQSELDGVTRNRSIFERIARELSEMGIEKTWQQCCTKIKNLCFVYKATEKPSTAAAERLHMDRPLLSYTH